MGIDIGIWIAIIMGGIILLYASMNKGSVAMKKPNKILSFTTEMPGERILKVIIQLAQKGDYKVDDFNEGDLIIVLSSSGSLANDGFIFPIYITKQSDNLSLIEVGIKSKSTQMFGLNAPHERCFNNIKAAIFAAT